MGIGKQVGQDVYVYLDYIEESELANLAEWIQAEMERLSSTTDGLPNVLKCNKKTGKFSLLQYASFEMDPFPRLEASWTYQGKLDGSPTFRTYRDSANPPILHRKELLVGEAHPNRAKWMRCTSEAESLGLFDDVSTIGFFLNWSRLIVQRGYVLIDHEFHPIANVAEDEELTTQTLAFNDRIDRHLTALVRTNLSAPVQALIRLDLLKETSTFFDYGCGRGNDIATLSSNGFDASGWDPHYAPDHPLRAADFVNVGFVVNVIEDPAERVDALRNAFKLASRAMSVGVMLYSREVAGTPYGDGYRTSKNTFQKYFSQSEFRDFLEHALETEIHLVGPGLAIAFKDKELQQTFESARYRSKNVADRLLRIQYVHAARVTTPTYAKKREQKAAFSAEKLLSLRPIFESLWRQSLDLGRFPEESEFANADELKGSFRSFAAALQRLSKDYDLALLKSASNTRKDDLRVFFAMQHFEKRPPLRALEPGLQRDVKAFFGDYTNARNEGLLLLRDSADTVKVRAACSTASGKGIGHWMGDGAYQVHITMVEQLPPILRIYIACGLLLYESISAVDLIKIHVNTHKLTLLEYADFNSSPIPTLRKRIKINIRKVEYNVFDYDEHHQLGRLLGNKSAFISDEDETYPDQVLFDKMLEEMGLHPDPKHGHYHIDVLSELKARRLDINGFRLVASRSIPDIDIKCGRYLRYRDFIECGETQAKFNLPNLPNSPDSYNAIYQLATEVLDPIIEYFGQIKLTYGFCSPELSKLIKGRIEPRLDQHSSCEVNKVGGLICDRGGAACDFIVEEEDMKEVADWIIENLPFDRLYFYGEDRPLHVSYGPQHMRSAVHMKMTASGRLVPQKYK